MNRISLSGGTFRIIESGKPVTVVDSDNIKFVILNAAKISRSYYANAFDANNPTPPTCWSADTTQPSPDVPMEDRQASRCMDCPQNIRGSGQGGGRACRFAQRLAVVLDGQLDKVYQLQLPATSIFGRAVDGKMPMQAYAQYLNYHSTSPISVITECAFDQNSVVPKLFFKAVRPLEESEVSLAMERADSPETKEA